MISRAWRGLRGRLLLALVFTSAATLAVAAAVTLSPLQSRLRAESVDSLRTAVDDTLPGYNAALEATRRLTPEDEAAGRAASPTDKHAQYAAATAARRLRRYNRLASLNDLRERSGARVLVADGSFTSASGDEVPAFLSDSDFGFTSQQNALAVAIKAQLQNSTVVEIHEDDLFVAEPLSDGGVIVAQRQLAEVTTAVKLVRNALVTAAAIGLAVAVGLGLALSNTLTRRLGRLQRAALRITQDGPEAPAPTDRSNDEVGDLARAIGRMQEELRRQESARRSFVATASHELRTPLTMLQGTMELLDEDLREGTDLADAQMQVELARRELRRLAVLATELLDLSRLDAAVQLRTEPVELGEITRAVVAEFSLHAAERNVELELVRTDEPCWASADPAACARVVRILLDNALRYAPEGEPITVSARKEASRVVVEVADRGPGVPPDEHEHIFERFHRGKATSVESGFGLGLAIGRELAERMNGRLSLEDSEIGARFRLTLLPAAAASSGSSHTRSPAPGSAAAARSERAAPS